MNISQQNIVQDFTPLPKQKLFFYRIFYDDNAKFIWYCGGFGSGKSYIGAQTAIRLAMMAPNGRGLIARNTLVDLKATTMKTFFEVCDRRLIRSFNKSENLLTMINGHEIYFWGLDDIEKLKSLELGWWWMDEVDEVQQIAFEVAQGRLRHKAQPKRLGYITSNSEGKNWTYKKFVRGEGVRSKKDLMKYCVIKAPSTENTNLPDDYLEVLNSYVGDLYDRYVMASFDVFEGQIFKEFRRDTHVIKPFAIPSTWERGRSIDHGERNPTAVGWYAVSPDGDIFKYREHYKSGLYVPQHAEIVAEKSKEEDISYTMIDPSTKSVRGSTGKKVDKEWREELGKYEDEVSLKYGVNSVNAGLARMHTYLTVDKDRVHPITGKKGAPKFYIFDTCPVSIDEMETYKWAKVQTASEHDPEEKVRKRDDHSVDECRYFIMSRPRSEVGNVLSNSNRDRLQELKKSKRDQALPVTDDDLMDMMRKENPEDFLH